MFFTRLRTHSKWVFVVLAAAFAIGFLAFGVGAGGTGFGDAIADFFGGGDDTPTLQDAQAKVDENPADAEAVLELANLHEGARRYEDAAATLERLRRAPARRRRHAPPSWIRLRQPCRPDRR